jgi:hypothetical protein
VYSVESIFEYQNRPYGSAAGDDRARVKCRHGMKVAIHGQRSLNLKRLNGECFFLQYENLC